MSYEVVYQNRDGSWDAIECDSPAQAEQVVAELSARREVRRNSIRVEEIDNGPSDVESVWDALAQGDFVVHAEGHVENPAEEERQDVMLPALLLLPTADDPEAEAEETSASAED